MVSIEDDICIDSLVLETKQQNLGYGIDSLKLATL